MGRTPFQDRDDAKQASPEAHGAIDETVADAVVEEPAAASVAAEADAPAPEVIEPIDTTEERAYPPAKVGEDGGYDYLSERAEEAKSRSLPPA